MDLDKIREMIALMEEHDLTEMEVSNGEEQIRLKKGKNLSDREDAALQKKEQELFDREMALKEEEQKLLNLEEYKKKSKETVKA